jgi:hypothetical protein
MTMTAGDDTRPKRRRNGAALGPVLVSGTRLAAHVGLSRQHVDRLAQQGVIERRADGLFDQDASRLRYFNFLRAEHRRSPRTEADAAHVAVKTEMLQLRLLERRNALVKREDVNAMIDQMAGLLLTRLSGFPARCGGHDLSVRRSIERAVFDLRREISEAATAMADQRNEPPLEDQP